MLKFYTKAMILVAAFLVANIVFAGCKEPKGRLGTNLQANDKFIAELKTYDKCLKRELTEKYSKSNIQRYNEQKAEVRALGMSISNTAEKEKQMLNPLRDTEKYGYGDDGWLPGPPLRDPEQQKNYENYQNEKRKQVKEAAKRMGLQLE